MSKIEKQYRLEELRERLSKTVDGMNEPIDPGIFETVLYLNALGLPTDGSCEGHLEGGPRWAPSKTPWVQVSAAVPEGIEWYEDQKLRQEVSDNACRLQHSAINLLHEFYHRKNKTPYPLMLMLKNMGYGFRIQSVCTDTIHLYSGFIQRDYHERAKKEMESFTRFIKKLYFDRYGRI